MKVYNDISLKAYNTFGIEARAHCLVVCETLADARDIAKPIADGRHLVLGGGSNMLFTSDFNGVIVRPDIKGMEIIEETADEVTVRVGAGVVWDDFVAQTVQRNWYGIENLSGIPGTVGASPVQNVGAYGMEAAQTISRVQGYFIGSAEPFVLSAEECHFAYRSSVFKTDPRFQNNVIVTAVDFKLRKNGSLNLSYGPIQQMVKTPSLAAVRQAVIEVRNSKLPDYKVTGNAGSFFKNPEVDAALAHQISLKYPSMPQYPLADDRVKIPAAWLIEQAGWKGKSLGKAAVHANQALVLINLGGATGNDILALAEQIQKSISNMFGISLSMEVCKI